MDRGSFFPGPVVAGVDTALLAPGFRARDRAFARRITLVTLAALLLAGCDSHAYYEEAKLYVSEAQGVLREARVCGARVPCDDLVKFEAGAWRLGPFSRGGVSINVYQVADKAVADRIVQRFDERQRSMPDVPVHVRIYASRRGEAKRLTLERKLG